MGLLLSFSLQFKDPWEVHLSITTTISNNAAYWSQISWELGKQILRLKINPLSTLSLHKAFL